MFLETSVSLYELIWRHSSEQRRYFHRRKNLISVSNMFIDSMVLEDGYEGVQIILLPGSFWQVDCTGISLSNQSGLRLFVK
jgi:hypothetical protein